MKNIVYYIGGSPCSYKTTVANKLAEQYNIKIYNADNHIERYLDIGARKRNKVLKKMRRVSVFEQWFLDLELQLKNEIELYNFSGKIIKADLKRFYKGKDVIVEGSPIIPKFIYKRGIDTDKYVILVSSKSFQRAIFEQRDYIDRYLNLTKDKSLAFENWLTRDEMISNYYREEGEKHGHKCIEINKDTKLEDVCNEVKEHFGLKGGSL